VEDDLAGLLECFGFGCSLGAVDMGEGEDGFDCVTGGERNGLDGVEADVLLIGDGILEAGRIG
jgi:hypothetical protein